MNKVEWEKQLNAALSSLSYSEGNRVLQYYDELFYDRLDSGESEADIIQSFGSPKEIVERVRLEGVAASSDALPLGGGEGIESGESSADEKRGKGWLGNPFVVVLLIIFAAPVAIGLAGAAFGVVVAALSVIFALFVALWAVVFALSCTAVACVVAGVVAGIVSLAALAATPAVGAVQLGMCLIVFGLGLMMVRGIKPMLVFSKTVTVVSARATAAACRGIFKRSKR